MRRSSGLLALLFLTAAPCLAFADDKPIPPFFQVTDDMRIKAITEGSARELLVIGWSVATLAFIVAITAEQLKTFEGKPPQHGAVVARTLVVAMALGAYGPFCQQVWEISRSIAANILDQQKVDVFAASLKTLVAQAYAALARDTAAASLSVFRNAILSCMMDCLVWGVSWAIDGIRIVQVLIFNLVFMFGPICLGLHVAGFKTGQLWLTALLEVCTWNITIAIVVVGLETRVLAQIDANTRQGLLQLDWWRDMKEVTFLALCIFCVPIITARFFGFAALGEFSKTVLGTQATMAVASALISTGALKSTPPPPSSQASTPQPPNQKRAGD